MSAFWYGVILQWKLDLRNKEVLLVYYLVPLLFFIFMGGVFTSIIPDASETLIPTMIVFGISMGALLGTPTPLIQLYRSEIKKAYKVGGIPLWSAVVNNFISAFIHLFVMSLIIFIVAPLLYDAAIPEHLPEFIASLALFLTVSLSVATVLGLLVKKESKLVMMSQLVFLPSIILSGIMFPADMLPEALQRLGGLFPATWGFELMQRNQLSLTAVLPLLIILVVMVLLIVWLYTRLDKD